MKRNHLFLFTFLIVLFGVLCLSANAQQSIPDWVRNDWDQRTQKTGTWIADNTPHQSAEEPFEAFGMKWSYAPGKQYMKGQLFAVKDGVHTSPMWVFTEYWDAVDQELKVIQIGSNGAVGQGTIKKESDGRLREQQLFHAPQGLTFETGHLVWIENGVQHTESFVIKNGEWKKNRYYQWRLQEEEASSKIPDIYRDIAYFIGTWEIELGDSMVARMHFDWADNQRMIYYKGDHTTPNDSRFITESEGIITYHGVKDQLVFLNTYMGENDYLISEGHYELLADGTMERSFTCHYKEGETLPWSNGAVAGKGGKSIEFKQLWKPVGEDAFEGDFYWKKDGKWVHPIKSYDQKDHKEVWKRKKS